MASLEIPGFYRDPDTGRYFRQIDGQPPLRQEKNPKHKNIECIPNTVPKSKNVLELLQSRQLGLRKNLSFDIPFLKIKTKTFKLSHSIMCVKRENSARDILYLKGGDNSIYGLWDTLPHVNFGHYNIVHEVALQPTIAPFNLGMVVRNVSVEDFCDGFWDKKVFMMISNELRSNKGTTQVIVRDRNSNGDQREYTLASTKKRAVFCCAANSHEEKFVVGSENLIYIDSVANNLYSKAINGKVHAVQFNNMGSVVYCGVHTGKLVTSDLRTKTNYVTKLHNVTIDEVKMLEDENQLIIGAIDGALLKYDLRMEGTIAEYIGHIHTKKKTPFSVSNSFNLLCATGADNLTRLWSLDGGTPVSIFNPPIPDDPHRCWLVDNEHSKSMCVFQKDRKYVCNIQDLDGKDNEVIEVNED